MASMTVGEMMRVLESSVNSGVVPLSAEVRCSAVLFGCGDNSIKHVEICVRDDGSSKKTTVYLRTTEIGG